MIVCRAVNMKSYDICLQSYFISCRMQPERRGLPCFCESCTKKRVAICELVWLILTERGFIMHLSKESRRPGGSRGESKYLFSGAAFKTAERRVYGLYGYF